MTKLNLLKKFALSSIAKDSLKIKYIKDSIVRVDENFDGKKIPIFVKVYRITQVPDYKHLSNKDRKEWDLKIQALIEKLPTQVQLSYKSVNVNTKVNFWKINKGILEQNIKSLDKKVQKKHLDLFAELEIFCYEHIVKPRQLEIRREYYLTIPYFRYENFKGHYNPRKINELENQINQYCDDKKLMPLKEELYKESIGKAHDFKQEKLMKDFYNECEKTLNIEFPNAQALSDQELATLYYSRYFHNLYTELNGEMIYLTIHEIIQIASEFRSEFSRLHKHFPFKKKVRPNYIEYNNRHYAIISIFRQSDYVNENQLDFMSELEGDIDFQISFTPIEKKAMVHQYDQVIETLGHEIEKRQAEDNIDENLIVMYNKEKLRRDYLNLESTKAFKFRSYILVREKTLKSLNEKTNEIINKILARGYWAKRISSDNLEVDLKTVSYTGVDCGKSGWKITNDSITRGLNFMHLDFDLHSAQGLISDLDVVEEQLELQESIKKERENKK